MDVSFWSANLSKSNPQAEWPSKHKMADEIDMDEMEEIILNLNTIVLGLDAKGTANGHVVTATTLNRFGEVVTVPLCRLRNGATEQVQLNQSFSAHTTFKLVEGGPVHLVGEERHSTLDFDSDDDDDLDDEEEEAIEKLVPEMSKKAAVAAAVKARNALLQRAKKDAEEGEDEIDEDDEEDEEDGENEDGEDDDNDDDEEDGEDDDDEDDEEGEDDEGEDDDDEEDDEEEEEEEEKEEPPAKRKKPAQPQPKGKGKSKAPLKTQPAKGKPQKKQPPQKRPEPTTPKGGASNIDNAKKQLMASPNVPKKKVKFDNYAKHTLKIQDDKARDSLWTWYQKNKK